MKFKLPLKDRVIMPELVADNYKIGLKGFRLRPVAIYINTNPKKSTKHSKS